MVARIRVGKSLKGAINYNEKKVKEGKAELIGAINYPGDAHKLNFHKKLNRLLRLAELNTRATSHCLHLSLNFDPSESFSDKRLQAIAVAYMQGIGFGSQPYLVYHHTDAAHQHIHIVSTNIKRDGKRISLHNVGKTISEKTRREIELNFNLVKAGQRRQSKLNELKAVNLRKVMYGKDETRRAITNVVSQVVSQYKFASLPELNAILQQLNIIADRGAEGSRMFEKKGLQYSLLNNNGEKIGVPIKASSIYNKPTLKFLESKFETNKRERQAYKSGLRERLTKVLATSADQQSFTAALKKENINVAWRINKDDFIYGITYVDHQTKSVFNGSELGKEWSAAALQSIWKAKSSELIIRPNKLSSASDQCENSVSNSKENPNHVLDILLNPNQSFDYIPRELKKKKRKKKGPRL